MTTDRILARRVVARFLEAKPYVKDKETKGRKAEKLADQIRDFTGLSKGMSLAIADAYVRGRDILRLAIQGGRSLDEDDPTNVGRWPIEKKRIVLREDEPDEFNEVRYVVEGPQGDLPFRQEGSQMILDFDLAKEMAAAT